MTTLTLTIPNSEVSFFKRLTEKMGWTAVVIPNHTMKKAPALYDPETGETLNEETMKVIENARKGKDIVKIGAFEDFKKFVETI